MNVKDHSARVKAVLTAVCAVSFLLVIVVSGFYFVDRYRAERSAKKCVRTEANRIAKELEKGVSEITAGAESIKKDFAAGSLTDKTIGKKLENGFQGNQYIFKCGAIYVPMSDGGTQPAASVHYERKDGKLRVSAVPEVDAAKEDWYKNALSGNFG
ncbi:MAG: hypothetical protein HQL28_06020, partial [Candidatus Omnitrophica bacterium]|nr:hypothetical protein [Candidatus Omnitrophota bacterium]